MDNIKQIRLTKENFTVEYENSSLKLAYRQENGKYVIDISELNLIDALRLTILCSTYCFIKDFKKKLCWIVGDEEIKRAISILCLKNIEQKVINRHPESKALIS